MYVVAEAEGAGGGRWEVGRRVGTGEARASLGDGHGFRCGANLGANRTTCSSHYTLLWFGTSLTIASLQ